MKKILADRTELIDSSGIRKVFAMAGQMKDPVDFSIGQAKPCLANAMACIRTVRHLSFSVFANVRSCSVVCRFLTVIIISLP